MSERQVRILCFGEAMVELSNFNSLENNVSVAFAGDTLNTAIYLKRLLREKALVDYFTVVGNDIFSKQMCQYMKTESVGISHIRYSDRRTVGIYSIDLDNTGERSFTYWRDNSAARLLFSESSDFDVLDRYDLIYFSGISLAILPLGIRGKVLDRIESLAGRVKVAFDANYRATLWKSIEEANASIERSFRICDFALPSLEDQKVLWPSKNEENIMQWFKKFGPLQTVLKRGERGPHLIGKINKNCTFPNSGEIIDTTAAGDSFNAGFLAAFLKGLSIVDCARCGHQVANLVISLRGAICPKTKFRKFIKNQRL